MPDFHALLRQHLLNAKLPPDVEEELASHLADVYEAKLNAGIEEHEAFEAVHTQIGNTVELLRGIRRYKGDRMRSFRRQILVPGLFATALITLAGNMVSTFRINHNFDPETFLTRNRVFFIGPTTRWGHLGFVHVDFPLILSCLVAGALAAYLSLLLGGTRRQRFWAALVPSIAPILILESSLAVEMAFGLVRDHSMPHMNVLLWLFTGYLIGFTVIPAIALILGAAPFLVHNEPSQTART